MRADNQFEAWSSHIVTLAQCFPSHSSGHYGLKLYEIDTFNWKTTISFPWAAKWVSEQANEWVQRRKQVSKTSSAKQANKRANVRTEEQVTHYSTCWFHIVSTHHAMRSQKWLSKITGVFSIISINWLIKGCPKKDFGKLEPLKSCGSMHWVQKVLK